MIPQKPKYFTLIVHYGDPATTHACLASLLAGNRLPDNIIVIDQAETPFVLEEKEVPICKIVRPMKNNGYAGGVNVGLGALIGLGAQPQDVIMVMNNDVTVSPETVTTIAAWFEDCTKPVLAGAVRRRTSLFTGRAAPTKTLAPSVSSIAYLDGSFLVARYDIWLRLKGIPDNYFLYWEDVLVSQRAHLQRIKLATIPRVGVHHQDTPPSPEALYYLVRNGAIFLTTETGMVWRLYWQLGNRLRLWWHTLQSSSPVRKAVISALEAAARGELGKHL